MYNQAQNFTNKNIIEPKKRGRPPSEDPIQTRKNRWKRFDKKPENVKLRR